MVNGLPYEFPTQCLPLSPVLQRLDPVNLEESTMDLIVDWCLDYDLHPRIKTHSIQDPRDSAFFESLNQNTLFALTIAANQLEIKPLLDACCLCVALKLQSLTPEDIRKEYNIVREFLPEEEAEARRSFEEMISPK